MRNSVVVDYLIDSIDYLIDTGLKISNIDTEFRLTLLNLFIKVN